MSYVEVEIYMGANECSDPNIDTLLTHVYQNQLLCNEKVMCNSFQGVEFIRICCQRDLNSLNTHSCCSFDKGRTTLPSCYAVQLSEGSSTEVFDEGNGESQGTSSVTWNIPNREFDGLWETLFFPGNLKRRLLNYALTSLQLAKKGVNPDIICCNRLILLHGPPGTGKTTLCKALAQKLSIRMNKHFPSALFIEVNCHSLFSKWFSESGKLVAKMFSTIREFASDPQILLVVLIDEVESLTAARQASINSGEPSDAIRVVNAVLTQLDILRFSPNVFVLATSNLSQVIDPAFSDRADIIQYVGPPGPEEISLILHSCFKELERIDILSACENYGVQDLSDECKGLSGRAVRKLPLMALSDWNYEMKMAEKLHLTSGKLLELVAKAARQLKANKQQLA